MYAKNTKKTTVVPLLFESYIAVAKNSAGSKLFQQFFCKVNGEMREVLGDGNLSCAFHISALLKMFSLIGDIQLTVHRTLDDMLASGWKKTTKARPGCVVVWKAKPADPKRMQREGNTYASQIKHLGIYLGNDQAVHNSNKKKVPVIDSINYRPIAMFLWHPKLGK